MQCMHASFFPIGSSFVQWLCKETSGWRSQQLRWSELSTCNCYPTVIVHPPPPPQWLAAAQPGKRGAVSLPRDRSVPAARSRCSGQPPRAGPPQPITVPRVNSNKLPPLPPLPTVPQAALVLPVSPALCVYRFHPSTLSFRKARGLGFTTMLIYSSSATWVSRPL